MFTVHPNGTTVGYRALQNVRNIKSDAQRFNTWVINASAHLQDPDFQAVQDDSGQVLIQTAIGAFSSMLDFVLKNDVLVGRLVWFQPAFSPLRKEARPIFALTFPGDGTVRLGDDAEAPELAPHHQGGWRPQEFLRLSYELLMGAGKAGK
jgi:hypothetical protein